MLTDSYTLKHLFEIRDSLSFLTKNFEPYWTAEFRRGLENALARVRGEIDGEISYEEDGNRNIGDLHPNNPDNQ